MKAYAEKLYKSREWQKVRNLYMTSAKWICERCGQPATICHHKKYVMEVVNIITGLLTKK